MCPRFCRNSRCHANFLYLRIFHLLVITWLIYCSSCFPLVSADRINIKKTGWSDQLIIASFANCASQTLWAWHFPSGSWDICVKGLSTWPKTCEEGILWQYKIKKSFLKERKTHVYKWSTELAWNVIVAIWEWRSCLHRESQVYRLLFINCQTAK